MITPPSGQTRLASLAKWLSVRLRAKWFWVRVQLQSLHLQISRIQARKANVPSHLHIFRLNFDKPNHCFPNPFLLLGETDFQNNAAYKNE